MAERTSLVENMEQMIDSGSEAVGNLMARVDELIGDHGLFAQQVAPEEQIRRYMNIRNDPAAWRAVIERRGESEAVRYAAAMEKRLRSTQSG